MTKIELLRLAHQRLVDQLNPANQPKWEDLTEEQKGVRLTVDGEMKLVTARREDYERYVEQLRDTMVLGPIPHLKADEGRLLVERVFPKEVILDKTREVQEWYKGTDAYDLAWELLLYDYLEERYGTELVDNDLMISTCPDPNSNYEVWANEKLLETKDSLEGIDTFMWGFGEGKEYYFTIPGDAESLDDCKVAIYLMNEE